MTGPIGLVEPHPGSISLSVIEESVVESTGVERTQAGSSVPVAKVIFINDGGSTILIIDLLDAVRVRFNYYLIGTVYRIA